MSGVQVLGNLMLGKFGYPRPNLRYWADLRRPDLRDYHVSSDAVVPVLEG